MASLIHQKTKKTLAKNIFFSHSFLKRIQGLLGYSEIKPFEAMWIRPCSSIHTCFMKFPIDIIFTNKNFVIQNIVLNVEPWLFVNGSGESHCSFFKWLIHPSTYNFKNYFKVTNVFEFRGGFLSQFNLKKGDSLYVDS